MCLGANSVANGRFDPRFDCEVAIFWQVIRIWDSAKWVRDEIIVQGRLSFSLLRAKLSKDYMRIMCCAISTASRVKRQEAERWVHSLGGRSRAAQVPDVQAITSSGEVAEENAYLGRNLGFRTDAKGSKKRGVEETVC